MTSELSFHQASLKFSFIVYVGWSGSDIITKTSFFPPLMKAPLCREEEMETRITGLQPKDTSILGICLLVSGNEGFSLRTRAPGTRWPHSSFSIFSADSRWQALFMLLISYPVYPAQRWHLTGAL